MPGLPSTHSNPTPMPSMISCGSSIRDNSDKSTLIFGVIVIIAAMKSCTRAARACTFHFCFDLRHLKRDLAVSGNSSYRDNWTRDLPDNLLRPAYAVSWDRLASTFREIADLQPDPRLRSWEQLRRCPWAFRLVKARSPSRSAIRLPDPPTRVGFKHFPEYQTRGDRLVPRPRQARRVVPERTGTPPQAFIELEFNVTSREQELFGRHAPAIFEQIIGATPQARHTASPGAQYPKFAGFQVNETGFRCYFYNGPGDKNPSSFCEGNRSRILLQGRHDFDSDGIPLGTTPNQIFDWIVSQNRVEGDAPPDDWIMRRYKAAVHDRASLAQFIDDHIVEMIAPPAPSVRPAWIEKLLGREDIPNTHVLIRGPQGCGKSTKTMTKIPTIYENDPGVIFFSSPSIQQAEEKIETFERVNKDERFVPYLYLSLTALYERFCPSSDRLDHIDILEEGGSSWLHAVFERQRDVYEAMFTYRCRLLDLRAEGKIPILFGTHETVRQHVDDGNDPVVLFARISAKNGSKRWDCRTGTTGAIACSAKTGFIGSSLMRSRRTISSACIRLKSSNGCSAARQRSGSLKFSTSLNAIRSSEPICPNIPART